MIIRNTLSLFAVFLLIAVPAHAEVSLNAGRIGAVDVPALADFYKGAFGLQEVNRLNLPGGNVEIMLNFGNTEMAAKANKNAEVVIMHRDSDDLQDPVPHLIFNVTDINATVAAVKAHGGNMPTEPFAFGNSGIMIGIGKDPAGNLFEMIQQP